MIGRRKMLTLLGSASVPVISGCADYPPHREISIGAISARRTESSWSLKLSVANDNTIGNEEANFHDVVVYAYSKQGQEIGKREIGDLTHEYSVNDGKDVTLDCQSFPYAVTFDAKESPCDENTKIMIGRYDGMRDGNYVWATDYRECGEGLPPEFSTTQSLPGE